ncbi:MAG: hypothetical protein LBQ49_00510 [Rickettsiales bacterium]|jgi:hypothetical protein|nr:hypothetical protein [Rickettsiales bacterium]
MAKEVKYTERDGEKFVPKKASWVKKIKVGFMAFTVLWFAAAIIVPLKVKNAYSEPIKKSLVVSVFFDLQQGIADQYAKLMNGIKKSINLEKPINSAMAKVKTASKPAAKAQETAAKSNKLAGALGKVGVNTKGAADALGKVDDTAGAINAQLDKIEKELVKTSKTEVDAMIDDAIRNQLDKATGGLSNVMLAKYNVKSIAPWRPGTWPVSNKIFAEISKSSASTVQIIMGTVNEYFGYVAWGLVALIWGAALFVWFMVFKKFKLMISPFIVCPNCGHAFTNKKRIALSLTKIFQPWNWI